MPGGAPELIQIGLLEADLYLSMREDLKHCGLSADIWLFKVVRADLREFVRGDPMGSRGAHLGARICVLSGAMGSKGAHLLAPVFSGRMR